MSNVSLERYYFVLYHGVLTSKMSKMALSAFCDKTLQIYAQNLFSLKSKMAAESAASETNVNKCQNVKQECQKNKFS